MSILDLHDNIIVKIASFSASSSLFDYINLHSVSKRFCFIYDDKKVLSTLSLPELDFFPYWNAPQYYSNLYNMLQLGGNPDAMFHVGLINFFHDIWQNEGNMLLMQAVEGGNKDVMYLYGVILLCEELVQGRELLSYLFKPLLSQTLEFLESHWMRARGLLRDRGEPQLIDLKRHYHRLKCCYDGETTQFLLENCTYFDPYGRRNNMDIEEACEDCLYNHESELFL